LRVVSLTILPNSVLRYNTKRWLLKTPPIDLGVKPRPVAIVTLRNRTLSPAVGFFVEHVRAVAKTMMTRSAWVALLYVLRRLCRHRETD
jgi:hypothetical protein